MDVNLNVCIDNLKSYYKSIINLSLNGILLDRIID
jgi:hypothetical protein